MKVIRITPGLGNQMFQYAFILNFKQKGEMIKLDLSPCFNSKKHNGFELENVFNIQEKKINFLEKIRFNGPFFYYKDREITFVKFINKIVSKFFKKKYALKIKSYVFENEAEDEFNFNSNYLNIIKDTYFSGYFNSYKYFEKINSTVINTFQFIRPLIKDLNIKSLEEIQKKESISIHVRRGDYLYGNLDVCGKNYFENSFKFIENKILIKKNVDKKNIKIFIFSDDIYWCKDNFDFLNDYDYVFVDWNKDEYSYIDMQLMSNCKHNIISNSTFSWWAAYLNKNKGKIVICPSFWFKNIKTSEDRYLPRWYLI